MTPHQPPLTFTFHVGPLLGRSCVSCRTGQASVRCERSDVDTSTVTLAGEDPSERQGRELCLFCASNELLRDGMAARTVY